MGTAIAKATAISKRAERILHATVHDLIVLPSKLNPFLSMLSISFAYGKNLTTPSKTKVLFKMVGTPSVTLKYSQ